MRINDNSLTTKYNPNLFSRWQNLYDYMSDYIKDYNLGEVYYKALQNRISLSILGAGINQAHSDDNLIQGGKHMEEMIDSPRYQKALSSLDISEMPFHWKVFFFFAKYNLTTLLFAMLKTIEYLRTHKNQ